MEPETAVIFVVVIVVVAYLAKKDKPEEPAGKDSEIIHFGKAGEMDVPGGTNTSKKTGTSTDPSTDPTTRPHGEDGPVVVPTEAPRTGESQKIVAVTDVMDVDEALEGKTVEKLRDGSQRVTMLLDPPIQVFRGDTVGFHSTAGVVAAGKSKGQRTVHKTAVAPPIPGQAIEVKKSAGDEWCFAVQLGVSKRYDLGEGEGLESIGPICKRDSALETQLGSESAWYSTHFLSDGGFLHMIQFVVALATPDSGKNKIRFFVSR